MKRLLILLAILVFTGGVSYTITVRGGAGPVKEHLGGPALNAPLVPLSELLTNPGKFTGKAVRVEGRIERQCPSSGCWFDLRGPKGDPLRVDMGHLGLKFPRRIGYTASVEGKLFQGKQRVELIGENVDFIRPPEAGK